MLIANQGPQEVQEPIGESVIIFKRDKTEWENQVKNIKTTGVVPFGVFNRAFSSHVAVRNSSYISIKHHPVIKCGS